MSHYEANCIHCGNPCYMAHEPPPPRVICPVCETMTLDEYQREAWGMALESARSEDYLYPGLIAEVGEFMDVEAKAVRDGVSDFAQYRENQKKELGDILWFVAGIVSHHGWSLSDIAGRNLQKLRSRKARGRLQGSGDDR